MKDFNFNRYKSLLSYSMAENKKTYFMAFGISILVVAMLQFLFAHTFIYQFGSRVAENLVQNSLDAGSIIAALGFAAVMVFVITQVELSNRYCIAREGTQYCMLPATYLEKGCVILTQFIIFNILATVVFYFVIYCMMALYYAYYDGFFTFQPFYIIKQVMYSMNIFDIKSAQPMDTSDTMDFIVTTRLLILMLPVSYIISILYYLTLVTFFRTKSQLKAYGTQLAINTVIQWFFLLCIPFALEHIEFLRRLPLQYFPYILDFCIIMQIPVAIAFGWWFFHRLHYKEIK
ncbi:MAG: hypothetical protein HUK06_04300 [Bacteroidaceae bacterium]|nr:hypothetical protein [Bacteroidaceae bacterium]